ncbi:MAG: hypothetical protein WCV63_07820 [Negativicutes bacterium]
MYFDHTILKRHFNMLNDISAKSAGELAHFTTVALDYVRHVIKSEQTLENLRDNITGSGSRSDFQYERKRYYDLRRNLHDHVIAAGLSLNRALANEDLPIFDADTRDNWAEIAVHLFVRANHSANLQELIHFLNLGYPRLFSEKHPQSIYDTYYEGGSKQ